MELFKRWLHPVSRMDPPVTSVSALIVRDGCFELAINQNIIMSDLVYPPMASQMEDEMRNLPSLTAVLFHGCYTWCIVEGDSDLMNKVRSHVSKKYSNVLLGLSLRVNFSFLLLIIEQIEIERARSKA